MADVIRREPALPLTVEEPDPAMSLLEQVSSLIEQGRRMAAAHVNAALTLTYWHVGRLVGADVLQHQRADYGKQIVATLSQQLVARYGRSYQARNLRRMIQFAQVFPDEKIVSSLMTQLSWTHLLQLLPLKSDAERTFYARQALEQRLSVRELQGIIQRKAFERSEIADAQVASGSAVPLDTFKDPYLLDFLGLQDTFHENDLESAIVHEMRAFLLEVGHGWAFIAQQKRIILDGEDFYLDLLFYSRPLHRLVAVELKVGRFKAAYEGQMKLYLKWLDRYERQPGEEAPIGLILCTETSREQVELLEMHKDGIVVAEYWTTLPPKAELEERLRVILRDAKERLARRELVTVSEEGEAAPSGTEEDEE